MHDWTERLSARFPEYKDQITFSTVIPPSEPEYGESEELSRYIKEKLNENDIKLYSHQSRSVDRFLNGENICLATGTASGKTLAYALCSAQIMHNNPRSNFLILYPTKALTRDQRVELEEIFSILEMDISIGIYDGDVSPDEKKRVRENADIILSNFTGLNLYLANHELWSGFFEYLSGVIIDEAHHYTGLFGMHVAWIIRRLRRVVDYYAGKSQFILSSATLGNPEEHSKNLVGVDFTVIEKDCSGRCARNLIFWNPPTIDERVGEKRSTHRESSDLLAHLVNEGLQTLMFVPSRKMAELQSLWSSERLKEEYGDPGVEVIPYHAGHTKNSRRETEERLKSAELSGVVSTTALQLGINIGSIDATLLSGYPGSRIDFWQQIGRAGRDPSGGESVLSVMVPFNSSLDQFIVENPDHLLEKSIEDAVIDLSNNQIFSKHMLASASELPLKEKDVEFFPPKFKAAAEMWKKEGSISGDLKTGYRHVKDDMPQQDIDLYSVGDENFEVFIRKDSEVKNLPEVEKSRAYRDLHPGAIYLYQGEYYKVVDFDDGMHPSITLEQTDTSFYTVTLRNTDIFDVEKEEEKSLGKVKLCRGKGSVSVNYFAYKKKRLSNDNVIGTEKTGLEPVRLNTHLTWIEIPSEVKMRLVDDDIEDGLDNMAYDGALHASEHALINMMPILMLVDKKDVGGLSTRSHPGSDSEGGTIFLYDGVEGGVGFVYDAYQRFGELARKAEKRLRNCTCESSKGCPACTFSANCGNDNTPLNKELAAELLKKMY